MDVRDYPRNLNQFVVSQKEAISKEIYYNVFHSEKSIYQIADESGVSIDSIRSLMSSEKIKDFRIESLLRLCYLLDFNVTIGR